MGEITKTVLVGFFTCDHMKVHLLSCYSEDERCQTAFSCVLLTLFQCSIHCAIVFGNVPFLLFFGLLIGRCVLMLKSYIATSWFGMSLTSPESLHKQLDVLHIILKYS